MQKKSVSISSLSANISANSGDLLKDHPYVCSIKRGEDANGVGLFKLTNEHSHQMVFLSNVELHESDSDDLKSGVITAEVLILVDKECVRKETASVFARSVLSYISRYKGINVTLNTLFYCSKKEIDAINQEFQKGIVEAKKNEKKVSKVFGSTNAMDGAGSIDSETKSKFIGIVKEAYFKNATDIHFNLSKEQDKAEIEIRLLKQIEPLRSGLGYGEVLEMLSSAYSSMAEGSSLSSGTFNIDEIQDARILINLNSREYIALRYASTPNAFGSTVVLRILPIGVEKKEVKSFKDAGFLESQEKQIRAIARNPKGCIFVCGETGSGKSTTLKMLVEKRIEERPGKRIYSIEQPVEYKMPKGVIQVSAGKLPLSEHLRATLRLDPDDVIVGEVRDNDTASLLLSAEETGHGLMCSLHTSSAMDVPARLTGEQLRLPIDGVTSARFISGIIYQTLIPVLCDECKIPISEAEEGAVDIELQERLDRIAEMPHDNIFIRNPKGCKCCNHRGVTRLEVCAEVVQPDLKMKRLWSEKKFIEAYEHWRHTRQPDDLNNGQESTHESTQGLTALEVAILKMKKGRMCPIDIEREFGNIDEAQVLDDGVRNYKEV